MESGPARSFMTSAVAQVLQDCLLDATVDTDGGVKVVVEPLRPRG